MVITTLRRNDAEIAYLDSNPKGHSNCKFIPSLLVASVSKDTLRSSRLELNLNLNVALGIFIKMESSPHIIYVGDFLSSYEAIA